MATATRDALLDAAEATMAAEGIEHVSLRAIMRAAEANPAAVHYHFGSREALAEAVLDRLLEPLQARRLTLLDAAVQTHGPDVPLPALIEVLVRPDVELALTSLAATPAQPASSARSTPARQPSCAPASRRASHPSRSASSPT